MDDWLWLKALGVVYVVMFAALAYSALLVGLVAWVSEWMLVPGILLMPILAMAGVAVLARD